MLTVQSPKILIQANIVKETEWWQVSRLYTVCSLHPMIGNSRDGQLKGWTWSDEVKEYMLQATAEPNLWKILGRHRGPDQPPSAGSWNTVGYMVVYVDDLLMVGEESAVQAALQKAQSTWTCSSPEWASEKAMKFCGFDVKRTEYGLEINQQSYTTDLLQRHGITSRHPRFQCLKNLRSTPRRS